MVLAPEKRVLQHINHSLVDARFLVFTGACHIQRLDSVLPGKPLQGQRRFIATGPGSVDAGFPVLPGKPDGLQ